MHACLKAAEYAASHVQELVIDRQAAEGGDTIALLLLCQQGKQQA